MKKSKPPYAKIIIELDLVCGKKNIDVEYIEHIIRDEIDHAVRGAGKWLEARPLGNEEDKLSISAKNLHWSLE